MYDCKGYKHFNADGAPYLWMEPTWKEQQLNHYPPLKCSICNQKFPGKMSQSNKLDLHKYQIGNCIVSVWRVPGDWYKTMPWRFSIKEIGKPGEHIFTGVPNYCATKKSAMKRAWYRAKWINEGTWNQHYK